MATFDHVVESEMVSGDRVKEFRKDGNAERDFHVGIGEIVVERAPARLTTVLGSCIALVLYVPGKGLGGLAHILIQGDDEEGNFKYSGPATREILSRMRREAGPTEEIIAKIAGGASNTFAGDSTFLKNLGKRTMLHVVSILVEEGIDIWGMHVGGIKGRNIIFDVDTGRVEIRTGGELIEI